MQAWLACARPQSSSASPSPYLVPGATQSRSRAVTRWCVPGVLPEGWWLAGSCHCRRPGSQTSAEKKESSPRMPPAWPCAPCPACQNLGAEARPPTGSGSHLSTLPSCSRAGTDARTRAAPRGRSWPSAGSFPRSWPAVALPGQTVAVWSVGAGPTASPWPSPVGGPWEARGVSACAASFSGASGRGLQTSVPFRRVAVRLSVVPCFCRNCWRQQVSEGSAMWSRSRYLWA